MALWEKGESHKQGMERDTNLPSKLNGDKDKKQNLVCHSNVTRNVRASKDSVIDQDTNLRG